MKCRAHDSLRGYFHQSYQDSSSERVIDGTNSTISEKDSNLDEKNKRHTSLLVPAIGTSKDRGCYDVYIRSLHLSYISLR